MSKPADPEQASETDDSPQTPWVPEMSFTQTVSAAIRDFYDNADTILEYGMGGSTAYAASLAGKTIFSVENAQDWYTQMVDYFDRNPPKAKLTLHHQDIGPTGKWGRPRNTSGWRTYHLYPFGIWQHPDFQHPDLILIDGRVRTGCFLASLVSCQKPVTVLMDDYKRRLHYHVVEQFAPLKEMIGRLGVFEIKPTTLKPEDYLIFCEEMTKTE
ncbi:hypothetical protein [Pseudaestuariivita rosea]|uniref:hypothetical protein n=1 Tax=Pseudaestuariivita rosea TaxID=2763263 RepID=UPI001F2C132F|nr:hypothetical protein [Pseudaestuariivita rosea]